MSDIDLMATWTAAQWRAFLRAEDLANKREERREIKAAAVACLIEALDEMRPYLPEADA